MNIDCEIGIRGDTCQCSALSLGCRQAWGRYRGATVACRHSSTLKAATFPLYLPREACLPFTGLIFLLEAPTIYSPLPSPSPSASHCAVSHLPPLSLSPCHPLRSAMPIHLPFLFFSPFVFLTLYLLFFFTPCPVDLRRDVTVRTRFYHHRRSLNSRYATMWSSSSSSRSRRSRRLSSSAVSFPLRLLPYGNNEKK